MTPTVSTDALPLRTDDHGILRVAGTRIPFDTVIREFLRGSAPEDIVSAFPSLALADVYTLIGHYLSHRPELDAYLARNQAAEDAIIADGRARQAGLKGRLLAREAERQAAGAPVPGG